MHDLTGKAFEAAFAGYEEKAERGEMSIHKKIKAVDLWRKMLGMLFETGHPWIAFKDPCNIRYTNQHQGKVHSSNLCTEITLHTNENEIAVCNLGSVNLVNHVNENGLDMEKLYIDPVIYPVNVAQQQPDYLFQVIQQVKVLSDPPPRTIIGLSNISQGTQQRPLINRIMLVMSIAAGLDAAIVDVLDSDLMDAAITAEMLLNHQIYSDSFLKAGRM